LVFVWLQVCAKRAASNEIREFIRRLISPRPVQQTVCHASKILATWWVCWHWFDKRLSPKIAIAVEQSAPFTNQIGIAQIERAVEIPQVEVAEILEKGEWIIHASGWRSSSAANRAISGGTSE
jgi:hypothetical protein